MVGVGVIVAVCVLCVFVSGVKGGVVFCSELVSCFFCDLSLPRNGRCWCCDGHVYVYGCCAITNNLVDVGV